MTILHKLKHSLVIYLSLVGLLTHLVVIAFVSYDLQKTKYLTYKIKDKIINTMNFAASSDQEHDLNVDISNNFPPWTPLDNKDDLTPGTLYIGDQQFKSINEAVIALKDGDTLKIGPGKYTTPIIINKDNVTIEGSGHVIFDGVKANGKATIITNGNNAKIINIECLNVTVRDKNGSCVRHQGNNLTVHHVYFHNSEQGILTNKNAGLVMITDSRFELLGKSGQAHGIYVQKGSQLQIYDSLFLAAKDEGHEIKSRAESTVIKNSVVANFSSNNSRLIDLPNGGHLLIQKSVLAQGPGSKNQDAIGFGLEGNHHGNNSISLVENSILLERNTSNILLHNEIEEVKISARGNVIVGGNDIELTGFNILYRNRIEAQIPPYPALPKRYQ